MPELSLPAPSLGLVKKKNRSQPGKKKKKEVGSEDSNMYKGTCGERLAYLGSQAQIHMAGESSVSYGVVGQEVPESGKREQALDAILDLDIYLYCKVLSQRSDLTQLENEKEHSGCRIKDRLSKNPSKKWQALNVKSW